MTSEEIRAKISVTETDRQLLENFERTIGELDFHKNSCGYFCYPKGSEMFAEDALNQIPCRTITELCMFLYGAYSYYNIVRRTDMCPKTTQEETIS